MILFFTVQDAQVGYTDNDLSSLYTSRVFINELFPDRDLVQGQNSVLFTLDLAYYPQERGPYNFQLLDVDISNGELSNRSRKLLGWYY